MRDMKYSDLAKICDKSRRVHGFGGFECFWVSAIDAFRENQSRSQSLIILIPFLIVWGKTKERYDREVVNILSSQVKPNPSSGATIEFMSTDSVAKANQVVGAKMFDPTKEWPWRDGIAHLKRITQSGDGAALISGIEAVFVAVLINSATAFEALVEDLYRAAEAAYPKTFSNVTAKDWVSFRSRRGFRTAYHRAFNHDAQSVLGVLQDKYIDALFLLRNVIVHKAGLADKDFLDGVAITPALSAFSKLNPGEKVQIDGEIVESIIDPVMKLGYKLVKEIDKWMHTHKTL